MSCKKQDLDAAVPYCPNEEVDPVNDEMADVGCAGTHEDEEISSGTAKRACLVLVLADSLGQLETLLELCLPFTSWQDLLMLSSVSRAFCTATCNPRLWASHCDDEWSDKVYVPTKLKQLRAGLVDPKRALLESLLDSKRQYIYRDELLEFDWYFRMKQSAGEHFTETDAWWCGGRSEPKKFYPDHSTSGGGSWRFVRQCCARVDSPIWGNGVYDDDDEAATDHEPKFGRFLRGRPRAGMTETPTKVVFRHADNWGFCLDGCWAVMTSWPMPLLGECPMLEDAGLKMNVENMQVEAMAYNSGGAIDPNDPEPPHLRCTEGEDGDGGGLRMVQVSINGRVVLLPLSMLLLMQRRLGSGDSDSEPEADHGDHTVDGRQDDDEASDGSGATNDGDGDDNVALLPSSSG